MHTLADQMHVLAPALMAHHSHGAIKAAGNLWNIAHGSQGQGPRVIVLLIAALIAGVILSALTSRNRTN